MRMRIRDPEIFLTWIRDGKNSDLGSGINIPDPQHCFLEKQQTPDETGVELYLGMDTLAFKLEADKALKSVLPDQKERALFLSNLKQGRGTYSYTSVLIEFISKCGS